MDFENSDEGYPGIAVDVLELTSRVRELEAEKEGWKETAAQHLRNEDYYRGLVQEIGKHFGADSYTSDDGSIQQDILCAKVPDLVARMNERLLELESERTLFHEYVAKNPKVMEDAEREMELTESICELEAELKTANIKIEALNKLIQIHQTYQTKQGEK